jgi:hypothetical protein
MDWRDFLTGKRARDDLFETFPPENRSDRSPALISDGESVLAARVAAKLLEVVAKRAGTRVDSSAIDTLLDVLDESLPEEARHHCDDEAGRILDWLEHGDEVAPDETETGLPPELDVMLEADLDNRLSVAAYAIESEYDVELEYFDEASNTWPLVAGTPLEITGDDDGDAPPSLRLERGDEEMEIPIRNIRWLMPIRHETSPDTDPMEEELGRVLDFPEDRAAPDDEASEDEPEA